MRTAAPVTLDIDAAEATPEAARFTAAVTAAVTATRRRVVARAEQLGAADEALAAATIPPELLLEPGMWELALVEHDVIPYLWGVVQTGADAAGLLGPGRFGIHHTAALRALTDCVYSLLHWSKTLQNIVVSSTDVAVREGWSIAQLAAEIDALDALGENLGATRIARTELPAALNAGFHSMLRASGITGTQEWSSVHDGRTRETHVEADGQQVPIGGKFVVGGYETPRPGWFGLPVHERVNCFPGWTAVQSIGDLEAVSRAWWTGGLVEVTLASGRKLSGTPNHPVLTPQGWVPLQLLAKGDSVLGDRTGIEVLTAGDPHEQERPPTIGEVFDLAVQAGVAQRVVRHAVDFHGDRPQSDVDVVRADGLLVDGVVWQGGQQLGFTAADVGAAPLAADSSSGSLLGGLDLTAAGGVRRSDEALAAVGAFAGHAEPVGVGAVPVQLGGQAADVPLDHVAATAHGSGDGKDRLAVPVPGHDLLGVDVVTDTRMVPWEGHVYTLQCSTGMFMAEGTVVRNCRCVTVVIPDDDPGGSPDGVSFSPSPAEQRRATRRGESAILRTVEAHLLAGRLTPDLDPYTLLGDADRVLDAIGPNATIDEIREAANAILAAMGLVAHLPGRHDQSTHGRGGGGGEGTGRLRRASGYSDESPESRSAMVARVVDDVLDRLNPGEREADRTRRIADLDAEIERLRQRAQAAHAAGDDKQLRVIGPALEEAKRQRFLLEGEGPITSGEVEREVSSLLIGWEGGSMNTRAQHFMAVVDDEFGLGAKVSMGGQLAFGLQTNEQLLAERGERGVAIDRAIARSVYEETQRQLGELGVTEVVAHRGVFIPSVSPEYESVIERVPPDRRANGETVTVAGPVYASRPLAAWSLDREWADSFGNRRNIGTADGVSVVVTASVPAEAIFALPWTGPGAAREAEIVTLPLPADAVEAELVVSTTDGLVAHLPGQHDQKTHGRGGGGGGSGPDLAKITIRESGYTATNPGPDRVHTVAELIADDRLVLPMSVAADLNSRKLGWMRSAAAERGWDTKAVDALDEALDQATEATFGWSRTPLADAVANVRAGRVGSDLERGLVLQAEWTDAVWQARYGNAATVDAYRVEREHVDTVGFPERRVTSWVVADAADQAVLGRWADSALGDVETRRESLARGDVIALPWGEGRFRSDYVNVKGEILAWDPRADGLTAHLPGRHDQSTHGRGGGGVKGEAAALVKRSADLTARSIDLQKRAFKLPERLWAELPKQEDALGEWPDDDAMATYQRALGEIRAEAGRMVAEGHALSRAISDAKEAVEMASPEWYALGDAARPLGQGVARAVMVEDEVTQAASDAHQLRLIRQKLADPEAFEAFLTEGRYGAALSKLPEGAFSKLDLLPGADVVDVLAAVDALHHPTGDIVRSTGPVRPAAPPSKRRAENGQEKLVAFCDRYEQSDLARQVAKRRLIAEAGDEAFRRDPSLPRQSWRQLANEVQGAWASSSMTTTSQAFQAAVAAELGLDASVDISPHPGYPRRSNQQALDLYDTTQGGVGSGGSSAHLRTLARVTYDLTQTRLRDLGVTGTVAHRGMRWGVDEYDPVPVDLLARIPGDAFKRTGDRFTYGDEGFAWIEPAVALEARPLASWSVERRFAENFADSDTNIEGRLGAVQTVRAPASAIFSMPTTGPGAAREWETVLLPTVPTSQVEWFYNPDYTDLDRLNLAASADGVIAPPIWVDPDWIRKLAPGPDQSGPLEETRAEQPVRAGDTLVAHLAGQHDQRTHGRKGGGAGAVGPDGKWRSSSKPRLQDLDPDTQRIIRDDVASAPLDRIQEIADEWGISVHDLWDIVGENQRQAEKAAEAQAPVPAPVHEPWEPHDGDTPEIAAIREKMRQAYEDRPETFEYQDALTRERLTGRVPNPEALVGIGVAVSDEVRRRLDALGGAATTPETRRAVTLEVMSELRAMGEDLTPDAEDGYVSRTYDPDSWGEEMVQARNIDPDYYFDEEDARREAAEVATDAVRYLPREWIARTPMPNVIVDDGGKLRTSDFAEYQHAPGGNAGRVVVRSGAVTTETLLHEFTHAVEWNSPAIAHATASYARYRIPADEVAVKGLIEGAPDVAVFADTWGNPYAGRAYLGDRQPYHEVITIGVEGAYRFDLQVDPGHRLWTLGVLATLPAGAYQLGGPT